MLAAANVQKPLFNGPARPSSAAATGVTLILRHPPSRTQSLSLPSLACMPVQVFDFTVATKETGMNLVYF